MEAIVVSPSSYPSFLSHPPMLGNHPVCAHSAIAAQLQLATDT